MVQKRARPRHQPARDGVGTSQPAAGIRWRVAAIVLAGALSYGAGLSHPFIFDDFGSVVLNPQVQEFTLVRALSPLPETPVGGRPLINLSFALNYAWGGLAVESYHVVNIALHIFCGLLVIGIIRRVLTTEGATDLAFAVALLWTVHPLNSEVVNYLTQRTESMMALCYLLTVYAASRSLTASRRLYWQGIAIAACAAGMACKESMVTAPLMVVLFDRVFAFGSLRDAWRSRRGFYLGLAASWTVLVVLLAEAPRTSGAGFATTHVSSWTYLLNQSVMIVRYLRLALWPDSLVLHYGWATPATIIDVWPYLIAVVALVTGAIWLLVTRPAIGVFAVWVFITLAPSSSIVPIATEVGAERRMYLPLFGVLTLGALGVAALWQRGDSRRRPPRAATAGVLVLATSLGLTTVARTQEYASPLTMAETILTRWPTPLAHQMVGTELASAGRPGAAIPHLRAAAEQVPPARFNLGKALIEVGSRDEGLAALERFVLDEPNLTTTRDARLLMARAYTETGRRPEAIDVLQDLLSRDASDAAAHGLLAEALAADRRFAVAIPHYQAFLASEPQDAAGWTGLGISLINTGRHTEAIDAFQRAVMADPGQLGYRMNLAKALLDSGRMTEALEQAKAAFTISPSEPGVLELLRAAGGR